MFKSREKSIKKRLLSHTIRAVCRIVFLGIPTEEIKFQKPLERLQCMTRKPAKKKTIFLLFNAVIFNRQIKVFITTIRYYIKSKVSHG